MALEPAVHDSLPTEVPTGITGVKAYKCGHVVTLIVTPSSTTASSAGWYTIGTLPSQLIPKDNMRFSGFDNGANRYASSPAIPIFINATGNIQVYFFNDHLTMQPFGMITYLTDK